MALYHRIKRQLLSRVGLTRLLLALGILISALLLWLVVFRPLAQKTVGFWDDFQQDLPNFQGRTNVLLLGIAGGDHDGSELTDTIIFVSVSHLTGEVDLISIPRDIWVPSMRAKINTAFYYGEQKLTGGGFTLAKSAVSEIIDQPVHYVAMIDFSNFEKVIDALGGVEIEVDKVIDDFKFPISGKENDECEGDSGYLCRYEHLHFDAGLQLMDGATALKYVRSRQAEGDEGTDFARSRRQEKLLLAIKTKLASAGTLSSPTTLKKLYDSYNEAVVTDFPAADFPALVKLGLKVIKKDLVNTYALSDPDQLYHPPVSPQHDNQWVLLPKDNNPQIIFDFVKGILQTP